MKWSSLKCGSRRFFLFYVGWRTLNPRTRFIFTWWWVQDVKNKIKKNGPKKIACIIHRDFMFFCPPISAPPWSHHHKPAWNNNVPPGGFLHTNTSSAITSLLMWGQKNKSCGSSSEQKAVVLKHLHHKSLSLHTFSRACDDTSVATLHTDTASLLHSTLEAGDYR